MHIPPPPLPSSPHPRSVQSALAAASDLDLQSFATSRFGDQVVEMSPDRARVAWLRWWGLFRDPDVWGDPDKRRAMLHARQEYQDVCLRTFRPR